MSFNQNHHYTLTPIYRHTHQAFLIRVPRGHFLSSTRTGQPRQFHQGRASTQQLSARQSSRLAATRQRCRTAYYVDCVRLNLVSFGELWWGILRSEKWRRPLFGVICLSRHTVWNIWTNLQSVRQKRLTAQRVNAPLEGLQWLSKELT